MQPESVIVIDPEILGGTPCFRGTHVPFDLLIDCIAAGDTLDEFLDCLPSVGREAAITALETIQPRQVVRIGAFKRQYEITKRS